MTYEKTISPFAASKIFILSCSIALITASHLGCESLDDSDDVLSLDEDGIGGDNRGIVGGEKTNYEEWKSVVALVAQQGMYASICTGTFISPQVLLTAGHCVYYPQEGIDAVAKPSSILVVGGSNIFRFSKKVTFPKVAKVIKHSSWRGNLNFASAVDLAMVKLERPVAGIHSYPVRESRIAKYEEGTIVGYGLEGSDENSSGIHRAGATTVLQAYQRVIELGYPSGTCKGDSGGPFFTTVNGQDVVSGVTSFGTSNTCYTNGGGYSVNVQTYRSWINTTLKTLVGYDLSNVPDSPTVEKPEPEEDPVEDPDKGEDNPADDPGDDPEPEPDDSPDDSEGNDDNSADDGADYPEGEDLEPNSVRKSTGCSLAAPMTKAVSPLNLLIKLIF